MNLFLFLYDAMKKGLRKILKWAGFLALLSVPIFLLSRKKKSGLRDKAGEDDNNIFAEELTDSGHE